MPEFKVGDEVIIRGIVASIDTDRDDLYPVQVRLTGTKGRYDLGFTKDGKYDEASDVPNLFHLSELENEVKSLKAQVEILKQLLIEMYETKNCK